MKRALALTLLAACTNTDVVAIDQGAGPDGGDVPPYCRGDGPPVLVGDGITVGEGNGSSDDVCSGEIAVRTFRKAMCACEDYVVSAELTTDSFDSAVGPYTPGGTEGAVGLNGRINTNAVLTIGGDLTSAGASAVFGRDASIAGDAAFAGPLGSNVNVDVAGNASVAGDISLISLDVGGTLTYPATATSGSTAITATSTVRAPVTVEPPCACAPEDLVDISDFVGSHRDDNENALIGLTPDRLNNYSGDVTLELPCGRYYLAPVHGQGALTIRAMGRVALLVDGDVSMTEPLRLELGTDDAELDLMITGNLTTDSTIMAGNPDHPARTRIYVDGEGTLQLSGGAEFAANLYAPKANLSTAGGLVMHGSVFARRFDQSAPMEIHYDVDVLRADAGCL